MLPFSPSGLLIMATFQHFLGKTFPRHFTVLLHKLFKKLYGKFVNRPFIQQRKDRPEYEQDPSQRQGERRILDTCLA